MSLRIWLPLNGKLDNQGLEQTIAINNGATINEEGKIGKCYQFNGSTSFIDTNYNIPNFALDKTYSVAFWIYSTNTSGIKPIIGIGPDWGWTIFQQDNDIRFVQWDEGGSRWGDPYVSNTIEINTWVHIVLIWKKGRLFFYKNGQEIGDWMAPTDRTIKVASDTIKIGGNIYAWGTNYFSGKLNDVRIYDHALSPLEVKQISQGLILHYPLNRGGWGNDNLGNFASVASNWIMENLSGSNYTDSSYGNVIKLVTSSTNQRMYNYVPASMWQSGKVYTVSFLAKADTNGRTCDMSRSIADFSSTFTLTTNWKRYNGKITSTATPNGGTLSFRIHQSGATVYITQIKVEEGELATPYCPYYNESLYTIMGLNSTTEYDCSGFGNNGTKIGTFSWTSDTPKYDVSTIFNGTERIKRNTLDGEIYTLACWAKTTKNKSTSQQIIADSKSEMTISFYNGTIIGVFGTTRGRGSKSTLGSSYKENNWNHFVVVKTGTSGERAIYCNGVLLTPTNNDYWGSASGFFVGARNDSQGNPFYGQICDVRAYATALSAQDVLSLYNNSAYIDNQGNIYGAAYEEV